MSIAENHYPGPKTKRNRIMRWHELADPVGYYRHLELLLAGVEVMLDSSRKHIYSRCQWGTGVTGLLLDSSCVNMENHALHLCGSLEKIEAVLMRSLTIGMLTRHYGAPLWRKKEGIEMAAKVNLSGPFEGDLHAFAKAWKRLESLTGKDIQQLNPSHPRATRIAFTGIEIRERHKGERRWHADFYVQYPREKYGSGWELSFLRTDALADSDEFNRGDDETAAAWLNRVADITTALLKKR